MNLSGKQRALARGAGTVLLTPPGDAAKHTGWHLLSSPHGEVVALWTPGVGSWETITGAKVYSERAVKAGWSYLRPATPF